jgi:hypothetical protein
MPTPYATPIELRLHLDSWDDKWEPVIQYCLDSAADLIDKTCNRGVSFVAAQTATTRQFVGSDTGSIFISDCMAVTQVETRSSASDAYAALTAGTWLAFSGDPRYPDFNQTPYNGVMLLSGGIFTRETYDRIALPTVRITARWGYADTVPPVIRQATIIQATRYFKRGQGAYADTLSTGDFSQLQYRKQLDPDVKAILTSARLIRPAI